MKAPSTKIRFSEAKKLLDYGFSNYEYKSLAKKDTTIKEVAISKGIKENLELVLEEDSGVLIKKGQSKNIEQSIRIDENIVAPVYERQKLGEVIFNLDGKEIGKTNIIAKESIDKKTFSNILSYVYKKWFCLLR